MGQHHYFINFFYHSCYLLPNSIVLCSWICWYLKECLAADTMKTCFVALYCKDVRFCLLDLECSLMCFKHWICVCVCVLFRTRVLLQLVYCSLGSGDSCKKPVWGWQVPWNCCTSWGRLEVAQFENMEFGYRPLVRNLETAVCPAGLPPHKWSILFHGTASLPRSG